MCNILYTYCDILFIDIKIKVIYTKDGNNNRKGKILRGSKYALPQPVGSAFLSLSIQER